MVGWNYLWLVVKCQFKITFHNTPTPGCNPPLTCQRPQRDVAEGDDDVWLAHLDFTLEEFEAITHRRQHELIPHHNVLSGYVGFALRDESINVVARWPNADDVCDEALGTHDSGFLEHLGKLLAGEADEGLAFGDLPFPRGFANDHHFSRAGAGWADLHGYLPPRWLSSLRAASTARASSRATSALA